MYDCIFILSFRIQCMKKMEKNSFRCARLQSAKEIMLASSALIATVLLNPVHWKPIWAQMLTFTLMFVTCVTLAPHVARTWDVILKSSTILTNLSNALNVNAHSETRRIIVIIWALTNSSSSSTIVKLVDEYFLNVLNCCYNIYIFFPYRFVALNSANENTGRITFATFIRFRVPPCNPFQLKCRKLELISHKRKSRLELSPK